MTIRTGGYSDVAAELTRVYGLEVPLDRRRVEVWNSRRTRNADGQMFPSPVKINDKAKPRQPRVLFDLDEVARWATPGVPAPHGDGFVPLSSYATKTDPCQRLGCGHARRSHIGGSGACLIGCHCNQFIGEE